MCFKMICEISLKAPFLRRYIQKGKGHSKMAPPNLCHGLLQGAVSYRPQIVLWLAKILIFDMTLPYLEGGEVLMRYETLYFQLRKKPHGISVTPPLLKGKKVMTATNMCSNFGSKWCNSPLKFLISYLCF